MRFPIRVAVLAAMLFAGLGAAEARPGPDPVPAREEVRRMVVQEALRSARVPPSLALAVAESESDFLADAVSSAGARGVMQIMPATARGEFGVAAEELWNPRLNIQLGVAFLDQLIGRYDGRWDLALSHYNGGSRVGRGRDARVIPATRSYVDKVLAAERRYARDGVAADLAAAVADATAGLERRAARQAEAAGISAADPARAEQRRRFLALADTALDAAALDAAALDAADRRRGDGPDIRLRQDRSRHGRGGGHLTSGALLQRIALRKARFRTLLEGG